MDDQDETNKNQKNQGDRKMNTTYMTYIKYNYWNNEKEDFVLIEDAEYLCDIRYNDSYIKVQLENEIAEKNKGKYEVTIKELRLINILM